MNHEDCLNSITLSCADIHSNVIYIFILCLEEHYEIAYQTGQFT